LKWRFVSVQVDMPKSSIFQRVRERAMALWDESVLGTGNEPTRLYRFIHFWQLVIKSFVRNRGPVRASALSYSTLLALIPVLALAMSITTGLLKDEGADEIERFIEQLVDAVIPPAVIDTNVIYSASEETGALPNELDMAESDGEGVVAEEGAAAVEGEVIASDSGSVTNLPSAGAPGDPAGAVITDNARVVQAQRDAARYIKQFIDNFSGAGLSLFAMIILIYLAVSMLSSIEDTFNDIWGVTQGRSWPTRVVLYWTTCTLGPLLLVAALGLSSGPQWQAAQTWLARYSLVGAVVFKLIPLVLLWLTFALFYKAVPNTKVNFSAAFVGALVGGTLWYLNNLFGFLYVSRVVTSYKIYGSLGLVPVFMFGLYLSWLILLLGAQVAYAFQNRALYFQEKLTENVNQRGREFVALRLMTCIGQRFEAGLRPPSVREMSVELGVPSRLVQQVLQTLLSARLVTEVSGTEPGYVPARPLESINAHHVLMAMRALQGQELLTRDEPVREEVYGEFARIQEAEKAVASSVSIMALVSRAMTRTELSPPQDGQAIKLKPALVPSSSSERQEKPPPPVQSLAAATAPLSPHDLPAQESAAAPAPDSSQPEPSPPSPPPTETVEEERDFPL